MRDNKYWTDRMENIILSSEKSVLAFEKLLEDAYNQSLIAIQVEIDAFFQRYAKDNKIPYAEVRRRLNTGERTNFNTLLKKWYSVAQQSGLPDEYSKYLKELGKKVYITRLESIEASIRFEIEKIKTGQHTWMTDLMETNYLASYYSSYFALAQGVEVSVKFGAVDRLGMERTIKTRWNERNYSDSIWADKTKLISTMQTILPRSFSQGLNSRTLGDMIAKELNVSKNRGRTLARTEINYICGQATLDTYKMAEVEQYQYLATLDMRTSDICRALDGFIGKVSQAKIGVNYPPAHPNCRSTTIPHFDDDWTKDRIAKDSQGGNIKVPRKMSQKEWIETHVPDTDKERLLNFMNKFPPLE